VEVISANDQITVAAQKELLVTCGGAYIKLEGGNIYIHAPGMIDIKGAQHSFGGPTSLSRAAQQFPRSSINLDQEFVLFLNNGEPVANRKFELLFEDGAKMHGVTDTQGKTGLKQAALPGRYRIKVLGPFDR
jgi:type VI secretion system secreted protein VgrG